LPVGRLRGGGGVCGGARRRAGALVAGAALATLLAAGATGCGPVPRVRYYSLETAASSVAAADTSGPSVRVERLEVAEPYDGRRIVYKPSRNEVAFWEFHQWAAPPARMITDRVAGRLRRSGLFGWVDSFPYSWGRVDFVLRGAVLAFEEVDREDGWYARVELFLELSEPGGDAPLWSSRVGAERKASGRQPAAVVDALSRALDEAVDEAASRMAVVVEALSREGAR